MQSFFLTALLVTSALAAPSSQSHRSMFKRQACDQTNQPTTDEVVTAINTWLIDVQTVNSFLDNAITQPDAVISQAPNVLTFASDEPNELGILARICGVTDQFTNAVTDLMNVFGPQVIGNLQALVDGTIDLQTAVNGINNVRCCNVLPDVQVLFSEAASTYGLNGMITTTVPLEMACSLPGITCGPRVGF